MANAKTGLLGLRGTNGVRVIRRVKADEWLDIFGSRVTESVGDSFVLRQADELVLSLLGTGTMQKIYERFPRLLSVSRAALIGSIESALPDSAHSSLSVKPEQVRFRKMRGPTGVMTNAEARTGLMMHQDLQAETAGVKAAIEGLAEREIVWLCNGQPRLPFGEVTSFKKDVDLNRVLAGLLPEHVVLLPVEILPIEA